MYLTLYPFLDEGLTAVHIRVSNGNDHEVHIDKAGIEYTDSKPTETAVLFNMLTEPAPGLLGTIPPRHSVTELFNSTQIDNWNLDANRPMVAWVRTSLNQTFKSKRGDMVTLEHVDSP